MFYGKGQIEVNWENRNSYPPRIKEFMMNPRAFTRKRIENLCKDFILSEEFMETYANFLDWYEISIHQHLSEKFIRKFKHRVYWSSITRNQNLSEQFIREFTNFIDWHAIPYENFKSIEFYREFKDRIDWIRFSYNVPLKKLSSTFINEFNNEEWWSFYKFRSHQLPIDIQMRYREQLVRNND